MSTESASPSKPSKRPYFYTPQRLIFPLAVIGLFWGAWLGVGFTDIAIFPKFLIRTLFILIMTLLISVWWLFFSRVKLTIRLAIFAFAILCGVASWLLLDPTVLTPIVVCWALPAICTAGVLWFTLTQGASALVNYGGLAAIIVLSWVPGPLVRMEGLAGNGAADVYWRWSPTAEDRFLADLPESTGDVSTADRIEVQPGDWSAFRGPAGDSRVTGLVVETDWKKNPPKKIWKHAIGPAWSSILVIGDRLYTQEQRGEVEATTCYSATTGKQIWVHELNGRFEEELGGVGPRATPAFGAGKIFSQSANGRLTCLHATTGDEIWAVDLIESYSAKLPIWGFSATPLFYNDCVYVFAGGEEKMFVALNAETGEEKWRAKSGVESYSSPALVNLQDTPQIVFLSQQSFDSYNPETGDILWSFPANDSTARPALQPQVVAESKLLIAFSFSGVQKLNVKKQQGEWSVEEIWFSGKFKPDFSDYVVHDGYVYGYDANIFSCITLETGDRQWKRGRYGAGQVLLLVDQSNLLVLTESGELKLVNCTPEKLEELASFQALNGKTWAHISVQGDRISIRNAEEIACFQLPTKSANGS